jgi:hypothetical protein
MTRNRAEFTCLEVYVEFGLWFARQLMVSLQSTGDVRGREATQGAVDKLTLRALLTRGRFLTLVQAIVPWRHEQL